MIKSIGDEVMFVAEVTVTACSIALDLVARFESDDRIRPRDGLCAGDVLFRLGDYCGPVINLASRLADEAVPGEVLADQSVSGIVGVIVEQAQRFRQPDPRLVSRVDRALNRATIGVAPRCSCTQVDSTSGEWRSSGIAGATDSAEDVTRDPIWGLDVGLG